MQRAWAFAVPFQVLRNPGVPTAAADSNGVTVEFFRFELRTQRTRFDGLGGIVCPQAGGFITPGAVAVNVLDKPER